MNEYAIDLHNHMPVCDADYRGPLHTSGEEVVAAALAAGIDMLGVSDHFSLGFFRHAHEAAEGTGLLVLPGAEVRLSFGEDEVHLVAVFPPEQAEARFDAFMDAIGFAEHTRTDPLDRVVVECDPVAAARAIADLGGLCVVAHVDRVFGDYRLLGRPLLRRIVEEAPEAVLEFVDEANVAALDGSLSGTPIVQSSDSHHTAEIGRRSTRIESRELSFEGLREALLPTARRSALAS